MTNWWYILGYYSYFYSYFYMKYFNLFIFTVLNMCFTKTTSSIRLITEKYIPFYPFVHPISILQRRFEFFELLLLFASMFITWFFHFRLLPTGLMVVMSWIVSSRNSCIEALTSDCDYIKRQSFFITEVIKLKWGP